MSLQSLECLLYHVWHLRPFDSLSSLLRTDRFLGDARFDLQINNILRGSEDTVYGNGLFLLSQEPCLYRTRFAYRLIRSYKGA
jgi:hypothetical protein